MRARITLLALLHVSLASWNAMAISLPAWNTADAYKMFSQHRVAALEEARYSQSADKEALRLYIVAIERFLAARDAGQNAAKPYATMIAAANKVINQSPFIYRSAGVPERVAFRFSESGAEAVISGQSKWELRLTPHDVEQFCKRYEEALQPGGTGSRDVLLTNLTAAEPQGGRRGSLALHFQGESKLPWVIVKSTEPAGFFTTLNTFRLLQAIESASQQRTLALRQKAQRVQASVFAPSTRVSNGPTTGQKVMDVLFGIAVLAHRASVAHQQWQTRFAPPLVIHSQSSGPTLSYDSRVGGYTDHRGTVLRPKLSDPYGRQYQDSGGTVYLREPAATGGRNDRFTPQR